MQWEFVFFFIVGKHCFLSRCAGFVLFCIVELGKQLTTWLLSYISKLMTFLLRFLFVCVCSLMATHETMNKIRSYKLTRFSERSNCRSIIMHFYMDILLNLNKWNHWRAPQICPNNDFGDLVILDFMAFSWQMCEYTFTSCEKLLVLCGSKY